MDGSKTCFFTIGTKGNEVERTKSISDYLTVSKENRSWSAGLQPYEILVGAGFEHAHPDSGYA